MDFDGKVVMVTGANRGIGFAIAELFLKQGARVVIADVSPPGPDVSALMATYPDKVRLVPMDVSSEHSVVSGVQSILKAWGRIDILVNNAGVEFYKPVTTTTEQEWDHLMGVNLKGVFLCSKAVIPHLTKPGGVILNIASELGLVGEANVAAYCASKGGVVMLTKAMAIDHGPEGIRVNCLCPGPISTELMEGVFRASDDPDGMRHDFESRILLNRLGTPEEVAKAAIFLAGDESSFMTGTNLVLDGGWTAR